MEFKAFPSIPRLESPITITEKIHGTNAAVYIFEYSSTNGVRHEPRLGIRAHSRNRIITPDDDNYGFATWVHANSEALIESLGVGHHFGEWYGSGVNYGYGLTEKRLALFNQEFATLPELLPSRVDVVPVLYFGVYSEAAVSAAMAKLSIEGSTLVPGFKKPEGIVVRFERGGATFKKVFEAEETGWKAGPPKEKRTQNDDPAVLALFQPIRLEKLFGRDERLLLGYPSSLPEIAREYLADLEREDQFIGVLPEVQKQVRRRLIPWVKEVVRVSQGLKA